MINLLIRSPFFELATLYKHQVDKIIHDNLQIFSNRFCFIKFRFGSAFAELTDKRTDLTPITAFSSWVNRCPMSMIRETFRGFYQKPKSRA